MQEATISDGQGMDFLLAPEEALVLGKSSEKLCVLACVHAPVWVCAYAQKTLGEVIPRYIKWEHIPNICVLEKSLS